MLDKLVGRLLSASLAVSGALLVAITSFILFEIALRAAFNVSTNVLVEFVGYAMAPMVTFAMASTMRNGQLIRVNLLMPYLPMSVRRWVEVCCVALTLSIVIWLAQLIWQDVVINWRRGAVSDTVARVPLWIAPTAALAGVTVFLVALAAYLLSLLRGGEPIKDPEAIAPVP